MVELVNAFDHLGQQRLDLLETGRAARAFLGNLEDLGFCFIQQLARFLALRVQGGRRDLVGNRHQLAQHGALAHDLGVAADVGGRRGVVRQRVQIRQAARVFGLAGADQRFVDGDDVGGPRQADQTGDVVPDQPVVVAVEVLFDQHVGNTVPRGVVQQQTAQHRLLRLDGMGGNAQVFKLGIGRCVHGFNSNGCRISATRKKPWISRDGRRRNRGRKGAATPQSTRASRFMRALTTVSGLLSR
ncbi:hypothetical protein D3C73_1070780 [compost metagenome]